MIPADTSTTTSASTQYHLRDVLRPIRQLLDAKHKPQGGEPWPTTKGSTMSPVFRFA